MLLNVLPIILSTIEQSTHDPPNSTDSLGYLLTEKYIFFRVQFFVGYHLYAYLCRVVLFPYQVRTLCVTILLPFPMPLLGLSRLVLPFSTLTFGKPHLGLINL